MMLELKTIMSSDAVDNEIKKQNENLHKHQIEPMLYGLTDPSKLSFIQRLAMRSLSVMIPKDTKTYLVLHLQELHEKKTGLKLLDYKNDTILLDYPDFFYDLLSKSEKSTLPEKIWDDLKKTGMIRKSKEQELNQLKKDFKASDGWWVENVA
jgi:hypothetical protein